MKYEEKEIHLRALNTEKIFNHEISIIITLNRYYDIIDLLNNIVGEKHKDWRMSALMKMNLLGNPYISYDLQKEHLPHSCPFHK